MPSYKVRVEVKNEVGIVQIHAADFYISAPSPLIAGRTIYDTVYKVLDLAEEDITKIIEVESKVEPENKVCGKCGTFMSVVPPVSKGCRIEHINWRSNAGINTTSH